VVLLEGLEVPATSFLIVKSAGQFRGQRVKVPAIKVDID